MELHFWKYQGTGNDFVMLDGREADYSFLDQKTIEKLCHRKFGIGADGLIILSKSDDCDFEMIYFNSDGRQSSMCGNGGRCIVKFAEFLGIKKDEYLFKAIDGMHRATIQNDNVSLQMKNVPKIEKRENGDVFLDTGSPHHIHFTDTILDENFIENSQKIRYSDVYKKEGVNVNFIKEKNGTLEMRTYERGVENETLSCGTGVTAAALAAFDSNVLKTNEIQVKTSGGDLKVSFEKTENGYENIWLTGSVERVFEGVVNVLN